MEMCESFRKISVIIVDNERKFNAVWEMSGCNDSLLKIS